jgi:hypothetical protein
MALGLIVLFCTVLTLNIPPKVGSSAAIGVGLIGIFLAIFHKGLAASIYRQVARIEAPWLLSFWSRLPERWLELFYLLSGVALLTTAIVLWIRGMFYS